MGTLVNAIKAIFASKKTTDSNYAVPLLNKNDASPAGYMELPDLAAVAAGKMIQLNSGDNLDDIRNTGNYNALSSSVSRNIGNAPYTDGGFILYVRPFTQPAQGFVIQYLIGFSAQAVYIRTYSSGNWGQWKSIVLS